MGDRNSGECRCGKRRRHTRHDFDGDAGRSQCQGFLAAPAEDEWVATLQAHDPMAARRRTNHQTMNRFLSHRMTARAFADVEAAGATCLVDDRERHQRVIEDEIGPPQKRQSAAGQQSGITRPGANERDTCVHAVTSGLVEAVDRFSSSGRRSAIATS